MNDYLTKPILRKSLSEALDKWLKPGNGTNDDSVVASVEKEKMTDMTSGAPPPTQAVRRSSIGRS